MLRSNEMVMPSLENPAEPATLLALTSQADYASRVSQVVQQVPSAADEAQALGLRVLSLPSGLRPGLVLRV